MSIDDSRPKMIPSLVATLSGLSLRESFRPRSIESPVRREKWESAFHELTTTLRTKLAIEDQNTGNTLDALESHINLYKRLYPEKRLLIMLDNFHLLADHGFSFGSTEREKTKQLSKRLIMATAAMLKGATKSQSR